MKKILVVEDSDMVMKILRHLVSQYPQYEPAFASSFAQAKELIEQHTDANSVSEFFAALVDLNLPDAPNGEVVDLVLQKKIPTIVLTGSYDEKKRELLYNKGIVDYLTKEGRYAYNKAVAMVQRLEKNQFIKVLVVDDSDMSRKYVANLFKRHMFQVLEAVDGVDAIKVMLENPDIKLLFTDYNMPRMDGFELVRNLRYKYEKSDLIMIGISGESSEALSAKFIKYGANDFLLKPFHPEEFYCRISHNIESLELLEQISQAAKCDYLTGLFHRYHFFEVATESYKSAKEKSSPLALAVINVDQFAKFNDRFGNAGGDTLLKFFAAQLKEMLNRFLLCRADSDNFYVLMPGLDNEKAIALLTKVRQLVGNNACELKDTKVTLSFSAGVSNLCDQGIDLQLKRSLHLLSLAKESGGSMVLGDEDFEESQSR